MGEVMNTGSTFVVELPEEFFGKSVLATKRELQSCFCADEPCFVLDLSQVREMDCAGLDMLLDCMQEIARKNGSVTIAGVSPQAATFLELARMDRALAMFPSVEETVPACPYAPAPTELISGVSPDVHSAAA
jgi:anti-anti-sigma factor